MNRTAEALPDPVLAATIARLLPVGTNRMGGASATPWVVLLPHLPIAEARVIGDASIDEIAGLARVADRIRIHGRRGRDGTEDPRFAAELVARHVDPARIDGPAPIDAATPGLLWIRNDGRIASGTAGSPGARGELDAGGTLEALVRATVDGGGTVITERDVPIRDLTWRRLRVGPIAGAIRTAFVEGDLRARNLARRHHLEESAVRRWLARRGVPRPRPLLAPATRIERALAGRVGRTVAIAGPGLDGTDPPAWLCALADGAGLDLRGASWTLAARGDYATQKILLVVETGDTDGAREIIVKVGFEPVTVARLEAAATALERLETIPAAQGRIPGVRFSGREGGLGVLAESVVDGRSFERLDSGEVATAAADLAGWLTELALATARPVDAAALRAALGRIVDAYAVAYRPDQHERQAIERRVQALADAQTPLRSAFMHGDPGVQNLLVDRAGRPVALDWENGDPSGLPLWDLLAFLRSYAVWQTAGGGRSSRFAAARRHLVEGSTLTPWLASHVDTYRRRLGLDPGVVEPLVTLGWVWLAARDAARLDPGRAEGGQAVRLARLFLERGAESAVLRHALGRP